MHLGDTKYFIDDLNGRREISKKEYESEYKKLIAKRKELKYKALTKIIKFFESIIYKLSKLRG